MSTLLLKFSGPWQAWGNDSRYTVRSTELEPTKSGVLGLLAAAQGRMRTDEVSDLAALRFGVRVDQPGTVEMDFQTARDSKSGKSWPLTKRYYLADAIFLVGIEGPDELLSGLEEAIRRPRFPLYLGRRSCPINHDVVIGMVELPLLPALREQEWLASERHRRSRPNPANLRIVRDSEAGEQGQTARDVPVSFSQERRLYTWRTVVSEDVVTVDNPDGSSTFDDFFEVVRTG
ncbi:type I-E CRISPR-associated protein Cas5/CasD [Brevibacterium sp.]|uniref:type I-E CRISPR-associated protein Cas5/CasD n=1 Tax=Brevibacterium sp. TaxID=1701 RepID=UPI0028117B5D|nr:type I-E CRISPR-associated protein Cas5/CasD [Brevibacterium sp.]